MNINKQAKLPASITVETALVLPIFMITVLSLCFFFRLMELQLYVQKAVTETVQEITAYGYLYKTAEAMVNEKAAELLQKTEFQDEAVSLVLSCADGPMLKLLTSRHIDLKRLSDYGICDGWSGFDFSKSKISTTDHCVRIELTYRVRLPLAVSYVPAFSVTQRAVGRLFSGTPEERPTEAGTVYVTETGRVYHLTQSCSHLKLTIRLVPTESLSVQRNQNGSIYYACEHCTKGGTIPESVYVSAEGNRYHVIRDCSGLKRTILAKTLDDVEGMTVCSRCSSAAEAEKNSGEQ